MSAVHRQWINAQASRLRTCHELGVCHGRPGPDCTCDAEPALPSGRETTRHYARTTDEAFKTPAWRNPVQGPYRRAGSGWAPVLACVALVLLLVAAPLLWRLLPVLAGGAA